MDERYSRNLPAVSEEEQAVLARRRVLVAGCGGLGGYLIEYLARMGVGEITAVDGDLFEPSNLNRQLLAVPSLLGTSKVLAAALRAGEVNPSVKFRAVEAFLAPHNADALVRGQDLVLDALDNIPARLLLEDACAAAGVTIVHGAVRSWSIQAAIIPPEAACSTASTAPPPPPMKRAPSRSRPPSARPSRPPRR